MRLFNTLNSIDSEENLESAFFINSDEELESLSKLEVLEMFELAAALFTLKSLNN